MSNLAYIIILITIFLISAIVCTRNYKNRAKKVGNNLLDYCFYIVEEFNALPKESQDNLINSLNEKESYIFNQLINKSPSLGKNLNVLQGQMFVFESIMEKIKSIKSKC
ncbi:MAG: hypothetical protein DBY38_00430 [Clostridium cadaveris]|uniref:Uncharacterized protein n=1 Tax=Clostridium cadaveris TaxID=1529 RepID=A0A316MBC6_9CLOT|nr:MAG: hypothetical protein DBY38_00430 [Clostridium cadaveris]